MKLEVLGGIMSSDQGTELWTRAGFLAIMNVNST